MDDEIEEFIRNNENCYDRFTFDKIFRFLLKNDFDNEDAKDVMFYNCSFSALVLQERIHNEFYKKINVEDEISEDLRALINEEAKKHLDKIISEVLNK